MKLLLVERLLLVRGTTDGKTDRGHQSAEREAGLPEFPPRFKRQGEHRREDDEGRQEVDKVSGEEETALPGTTDGPDDVTDVQEGGE